MPENLQVISHPLVQHKLSLMRKKSTSTQGFRTLIREVGTLLAYEVTKDLPLIYEEIETPLMKMDAPFLEGKKLCLVSILRAVMDCWMDLWNFFHLRESATLGYTVIQKHWSQFNIT